MLSRSRLLGFFFRAALVCLQPGSPGTDVPRPSRGVTVWAPGPGASRLLAGPRPVPRLLLAPGRPEPRPGLPRRWGRGAPHHAPSHTHGPLSRRTDAQARSFGVSPGHTLRTQRPALVAHSKTQPPVGTRGPADSLILTPGLPQDPGTLSHCSGSASCADPQVGPPGLPHGAP